MGAVQCALAGCRSRHSGTRVEQSRFGLRELCRHWLRDVPLLAEEGLDEHLLLHLNSVISLYCRAVASRVLRIGGEMTTAGGALHRVVSPLVHRCGRLRQLVEAYAAGS